MNTITDSPHINTLRRAGRRLTNARLAVLQALEAQNRHITSSELLAEVARIDPQVGRASVFRALDLFTQLGILRPTYIGKSMTPAWVLLSEGHHHHVICTSCHSVVELEDCGLGELATELQRQLDMRISGHMLEFYGVCADCESV